MEKFITDEIQSEAIADLAKIVSVPSYNEPAQPKAPFGKGPKRALDEVLAIVEIRLTKIQKATMAMQILVRVMKPLVSSVIWMKFLPEIWKLGMLNLIN